MSMLDTHRTFESLIAAGFSKEMAESLLDLHRESGDTLATKADLRELAQANKTDLSELAQANKTDLSKLAQANRADLQESAQQTKADLNALQQKVEALQQAMDERATKADLAVVVQANKAELRELELRMTVKVGVMLFALAGLLVALELLPL